MQSENSLKPNRQRDFIDGLKGIAILSVLLANWHYFGLKQAVQYWRSPFFPRLVWMSHFGVFLLFMVSGFAIFSSLEATRNEPHSVLAYYKRRFFRIFPLWWFSQMGYLLLNHFALSRFFCCFFLICGLHAGHNHLFPPGWSIPIEVSFYLVAPFLFSLIRSLRVATCFFIATLFLGCWWQPLAQPFLTNPNLVPPAHCYWFAFGIIFFFLYRTGIFRHLLLNRKIAFCFDVVAFIGVALFLKPQTWTGDRIPPFLALGGIFLASLTEHTLTGKLVRIPFVRLMGKACYSIYLVHYLVIIKLAPLVRSLIGSSPYFMDAALILSFSFLLAASAGIGLLSYFTLERFCRDLGKWVPLVLQDSCPATKRRRRHMTDLNGYPYNVRPFYARPDDWHPHRRW